MSPQTGLEEELHNADGVILFDGDCGFCRKVVGVLLRLRSEEKLLVCSTRSARGVAAARTLGGEPADTFAFVTPAGVYVGVDAYVRILSLGFRTRWLGWIIAAVPQVVSGYVYNWIGRHRSLLSSLLGSRQNQAIPPDRFVSGGV